jgi:hypothetical protein
MNVYETQLNLPATPGNVNLLEYFTCEIRKYLPPKTYPIRFVVTQSNRATYHIELGVLELDANAETPSPDSIFRFEKRPLENTREFNAVLLVPTGIGAVIGGHAGDATPTARLFASICDNLVTHPNVVNASDINEMTENTLYAEGSVICRLLMGTIGLQKVRSNRVLTVIEKHPHDELFVNGAINAVNAARASTGLNCDRILVLDPSMCLVAEYAPSGRAVGKVEGLEHLFTELWACRSEYDSVALSSIIKIPTRKLHAEYFHSTDELINPWGGVEAIFTHTVSSLFDVQSAHSPMIEDQLISNMDVGVVDPRKAAEAISFTYMQCILKGLQRAPRIISDVRAMAYPSVMTAADISCLVIPDGCIGLPTVAALEQGIPVIAVRGNTNIMRNDLSALPWATHQLHVVENYLEALGVMAALKSGIAIDTLRRPLVNAQASEKSVPIHQAQPTPIEAASTPRAHGIGSRI